MRANCISNVTWRQVPIVLANHARVGMPKYLSHDGQAHAGLHQGGRISMSQRMHADCRFDPRRFARCSHGSVLVVRSPWVAKSIPEYHIRFGAARGPAFERGFAIVGQVHATWPLCYARLRQALTLLITRFNVDFLRRFRSAVSMTGFAGSLLLRFFFGFGGRSPRRPFG